MYFKQFSPCIKSPLLQRTLDDPFIKQGMQVRSEYLKKLKLKAAAGGRTLKALLDEALADYLAKETGEEK